MSRQRILDQADRTLLAHLEEPVMVASPTGRVVFFNPAFARRFRAELAAALGRPLTQSLPGPAGETVLKQIQDMRGQNRGRQASVEVGSERMRASLSPILTGGRWLGAIVSFRDGDESHRRRQNLELFRFLLDDLDGRSCDAPSQPSDKALPERLQRLRDFSEVFFGEVRPERAALQPERLIGLAIKSMRQKAEERGVLLEDGTARELPRVQGDPSLLSRTLALLSDYMIQRTRPRQAVVLSAAVLGADGRELAVGQNEGGPFRLAYSITGLGVVETTTTWLTQKADLPANYHQLPDAQKDLGLRLIMAKRLIQGMDGQITLAAHETVGTTISFAMAAEIEPEPAEPPPA